MDRYFTRCAIAIAAVASLTLTGCIGTTAIQARGGSLQLNPRLRADLQASVDMQDGRYFADGDCPGAGNNDECRFVTPVRGSMVDQLNPNFLSRLRRSPYFWVEGDGYALLSYEFVGKGMSVVESDDPAVVIAGANGGVDIGTCFGFPALAPENRQAVPGMEQAVVTESSAFLDQFDVQVRECIADSTPAVSETLVRPTNCSDRSVKDMLPNRAATTPQTIPLCLVNVNGSQIFRDVSYALQPQAAPGVDLQAVWPGVTLSSFDLLPNLKTVPFDLKRTISRRLTRTGETQVNNDESVTHFFSWRVPLDNAEWQENFSPNIVVSRARVRRGPWSPGNNNYLDIERLEVANIDCQVRVPDTFDFDIPMCVPGRQGTFRVTPTYTFDALNAGRVDDGQRLLWDVRINVPRVELTDNEQLFLELDLTSIAPTGTSGAGLTAAPAGRNFGQLRVGSGTSQAGPSQSAFTLNNAGPLSVWVESAVIEGRDATEFAVELQRSNSAASSVTAPFIFLAGSTIQINVRPAFQSTGEKRAQVVVRFHDVSNRTRTLSLPLEAQAVSPDIQLLPNFVYFSATANAAGHAQVQRAAILINSGPIAFQRTSARIAGTHASEFRIISIDNGLGHTSVTQPITVNPGWSEIYQLGFRPLAMGDREATLIIDTNEGQFSIPLRGYCADHCTQPQPPIAQKPKLTPPGTAARFPKKLTIKKTSSQETNNKLFKR